jgi:hypothetical protein
MRDNRPATWPDGVRLELYILVGDQDFEQVHPARALRPRAIATATLVSLADL